MLLPAAATAAAMQYNEGPAAADTVTIELPGGVTVRETPLEKGCTCKLQNSEKVGLDEEI